MKISITLVFVCLSAQGVCQSKSPKPFQPITEKQNKVPSNKQNTTQSFNGQILWGWCATGLKIRGINPKTDITNYGTLLGKRYKLSTVQCNADGDRDGFVIEYNDDGVAVEYSYYLAGELDYRYHLKVSWKTKKPLEFTNKDKDGRRIGIEESHKDDLCYKALTRSYFDINGHCDSTVELDCRGERVYFSVNPD